MIAVIPRRQEGRFAVVTNVVRNAMDGPVLRDVQQRRGRRSRVVLTPQGLAFKSERSESLAKTTVAIGKVHRGEHV